MKPHPDFWAGRRVGVTGGTGFLGYHLVRLLLRLGARVHTLALPTADSHPLSSEARVQKHFGDVRDPAVVRQTLGNCEVVFHTAGVVAAAGAAVKQMHSVHIEGTRNVLETMRRDAILVHTSSIVAVGAARTPEPLDEESPFNLTGLKVPYVHAKRASEALALDAAARGRHVVVVNPGYLVGPEDHSRSIMGRLCSRFWKGRLPVAPRGGFNLVDVRDVARGHLLAAEHGRPGRRYILGGEDRPLLELLQLLAVTASFRPRGLSNLPRWTLQALAALSECGAWLTGGEADPSFQQVRLLHYYWFCRSNRAVRELGYQARPLAATLSDTYDWHRAQGKLRLRGVNRWWMRPAETFSQPVLPRTLPAMLGRAARRPARKRTCQEETPLLNTPAR